MKPKILIVFGTRPEAIKLAPVIHRMAASERLHPVVCVTAQHRGLLDQMMEVLEIPCDHDLDIMTERQSLESITTRSLEGLSPLVRSLQPACLLVQGDTTTAFAACLSAFYNNVPAGHVEAGLRTFDKRNPFPEEINRRLITHLADHHFAPTKRARQNLLAEGVPPESILLTGNTVVDACRWMLARLGRDNAAKPPADEVRVLLTMHRRENWGEPMRRVCRAINQLTAADSALRFYYPVHPNPAVRDVVQAEFAGNPRVRLLDAMDYPAFLALMSGCRLVMTDSGGVQEEVVSLGKPVVVLRAETERPEVIESGFGVLAGTDEQRIIASTRALLNGWQPQPGAAPFGDGHAAEHIVAFLEERYGR